MIVTLFPFKCITLIFFEGHDYTNIITNICEFDNKLEFEDSTRFYIYIYLSEEAISYQFLEHFRNKQGQLK